jgi:hypothetical protein
MHRIGRAHHPRQAEFADQHLHRRNFVALHHDGDVPEDDLRAHGERSEQLRHLRITRRVVAACQALAIMRDHLSKAAAERGMLRRSLLAERRFQCPAVNQADDPPQGRWRRCARHL